MAALGSPKETAPFSSAVPPARYTRVDRRTWLSQGSPLANQCFLKDTTYLKGSLIYRNVRPNHYDEMPASILKFVETVNRH